LQQKEKVMGGFPSNTVVAASFGGVGLTQDKYYAVLRFNADGQSPHHVALPPEQVGAVVASICGLPQRHDTGSGIVVVESFPYRDATIAPTADGALSLRIGFEEKSSIHIRLPKEGALQLSELLRQAATI
jgi:hypothetical protein